MDTIWVPIISLLIGATLTGAGFVLRERRLNVRACSRALSELLEIRHAALRAPRYLDEFAKRYNAPQAEWAHVKPILLSVVPKPVDAAIRYERAVDAISEFDALLAFRLRSKGLAADLDGWFNPLVRLTPGGASALPALVHVLNRELEPALDDAIRALAWRIGPVTWMRCVRYLRKPVELTADIERLLNRAMAELQQHMGTATPPAGAG